MPETSVTPMNIWPFRHEIRVKTHSSLPVKRIIFLLDSNPNYVTLILVNFFPCHIWKSVLWPSNYEYMRTDRHPNPHKRILWDVLCPKWHEKKYASFFNVRHFLSKITSAPMTLVLLSKIKKQRKRRTCGLIFLLPPFPLHTPVWPCESFLFFVSVKQNSGPIKISRWYPLPFFIPPPSSVLALPVQPTPSLQGLYYPFCSCHSPHLIPFSYHYIIPLQKKNPFQTSALACSFVPSSFLRNPPASIRSICHS